MQACQLLLLTPLLKYTFSRMVLFIFLIRQDGPWWLSSDTVLVALHRMLFSDTQVAPCPLFRKGRGRRSRATSLRSSLPLAATFAGTFPPAFPVHFWTDCTAAISLANGTAAPREEGLSFAARCRALCQLAEQGRCWSWNWVPSHQGRLFNDLADVVAKRCAARLLNISSLPPAFTALFRHPLCAWGWRVDHPDRTLPMLEELDSGIYEPVDLVPQEVISSLEPPEPVLSDRIRLSCALLLLNAQTLKGKREVYGAQLESFGISVAAFLETRAKKDLQTPCGSFFRFESAAAQGEGGCALYFRTASTSKALGFSPKTLTCVYASSQILAVSAPVAGTPHLFLCAHAPHSGKSKAIIQQWWEDLASLPFLPSFQGRLIFMIDANAQLGSIVSEAVGPHACSQECFAGRFLRELCEAREVMLPATHHNAAGQCHPIAQEPTWYSRAGHSSRIDYIGVPLSWRAGVLQPSVCTAFDTLCPNKDHIAVEVRAHLAVSGVKSHARQPTCPRDPARLDPSARFGLQLCLCNTPPMAWSLNVHSHTEYLYASLRLGCQFLQVPKRKFRAFISERTAMYLTYNHQLRRLLRQLDRLLRKLGRAPHTRSVEGWGVQEAEGIRDMTVAMLRGNQQLVRLSVAQDKADYAAAQLAACERASHARDHKALFRALRPLRPPGKRVQKPFGPLIVIHDASGSAAVTSAEAQLAKLKHFGAIEAGQEISYDQFGAALQTARAPPPGDGHFTLAQLPTLVQVEQRLRRVNGTKAPGPCQLSDWTWQTDVPTASRLLLPVFLKTRVRLTEPLHWKLTQAVSLFKGKGSTCHLQNYRAICLLDGMGKLGRKLERPELTATLERQLPAVMGSTPGSLSLAVHHELRTFHAIAKAHAWPSATLYLDATSAYYRVLREAFFQEVSTDAQFFHVLQALGVQPELFQQVAQWATSADLLQNLSPHSKRVIGTFLHTTAFRFENAPGLMQSRAGTRPGDSIADLLYSFLLQDMLREVQHELPAASCDPVLCHAAIDCPFQSTWADDVAQPFSAPDCDTLLRKAEQIVGVFHRAMLRRAVVPNYARGKTEFVFAFRGLGAMRSKRTLHVCKEALLRVEVGAQPLQVHCAQAYVHLGGIIHASGKPANDIAQKAATALAAVRPLARSVFRNTEVSWPTRTLLLESLGFSRLFYSATWGPLLKKEALALSHASAGLYGLLLPSRDSSGKMRRSTEQELCCALGLPPAGLRLATERVAHLARAAFGSDVLMQLLEAENRHPGSWLQECLSGIHTLIRGSFLPSSAAANFPHGFLDLVAYDPKVVTRGLRRARRSDGAGCGPLFPSAASSGPLQATTFQCDQCSALCDTHQKLAAHAFSAHGRHTEAEQFLGALSVPAVLCNFGIRRGCVGT